MGAVLIRNHGQSLVLNSAKAQGTNVDVPLFTNAALTVPVSLPLNIDDNTTIYASPGEIVLDIQSIDGFPAYDPRRVTVQRYATQTLHYTVELQDIIQEVGGGVSTTVADESVTSAKLGAGSVTTTKVAAKAIGRAQLDDATNAAIDLAAGSGVNDADATTKGVSKLAGDLTGTADLPLIAAGAVTTGKLADSAVTTQKIGDLQVTTAKIADLNVSTGKVADTAITTGKLADTSVTSAKIVDSNVTTAKLADDSVTQAKIGPGAVGTTEVADASITLSKLAPDAIPGTTNSQLFTVTVPGALALGTLADPGYSPPAAQTIGAFRAEVGFPPIGGPITLPVDVIGVSGVSTPGSISIPDKGLRGVLQGLTAAVEASGQVRIRCTSVGPTKPGGSSLQVTAFGPGVTLPTPGAAPATPTSFVGVAIAGGVQLTWDAMTGAARYLLEFDGVPQGYITGTSYTDVTTSTSRVYGLRSANLDAVSADATCGPFTPTTGAIYAGSDLAISGHDFTQVIGAGTGSNITVSGGSSLWTTGNTGTGDNSKSRRSAASYLSAVAATVTDVKVTIKLKWSQSSSGIRIKTRRNGSTDSQGVEAYVAYFGTNSLKIGYRKPGDSGTTYSDTGSKSTSTSAYFWAEWWDNPTAGIYELRLWQDGTARPSTADLAVAAGNLSNYNTSAVPGPNAIIFDQITTTPNSNRVVEIAEVRIEAL